MEVFTKKFESYGFCPQAFMPAYGMAESVLFVAGLKPLSKPPTILRLSAQDLETHTVRILDDNESGERNSISCGRGLSW